MFSKFRDPVSGLTHLFGMIASVVGLVVLVNISLRLNSGRYLIGSTIFGISSILLYSASAIYHLTYSSEIAIKVLRRIDHSMIFVLIAGSYSPLCLISLNGVVGYSILAIIWTVAILGILINNLWFSVPRWITTSVYVAMGWLIVVAFYPLSKVMPIVGIMWLLFGGVLYTVGGIIYALKIPKVKNKYFGFHEIFHIFVMLGSLCYYWFVLKYIILG